MKREFKFRAWDKENRQMIPVDMEYATGFFYSNVDQYEIMQFTGILDKNDKEIFEGDIVKFTRNTGNWLMQSKPNLMTTTHEVIWNQECCNLGLKNPGNIQKLRELKGRYVYEIIGNIYENQELLKK